MLIFGLGYTASRIADALRAMGWEVDATGAAGNIDFNDSATVRLLAPLLADKVTDPGVVVVDEAGRFAVSLLGDLHHEQLEVTAALVALVRVPREVAKVHDANT